MSILQQLAADVSVEEPEYNKCRIIGWSVEDNRIKVDYERSVLIYDYFYYEEDREVEFASVEFTINCTSVLTVRSEDVELGGVSHIKTNDVTYNQITNVDVETSASYNEKTLIDNLMLELTDSGPQPSIDMPLPFALVKFVELT